MQVDDFNTLLDKQHGKLWNVQGEWDASKVDVEIVTADRDLFDRPFERDDKFTIYVASGSPGRKSMLKVPAKGKRNLGDALYSSPAGRNKSVQFVYIVRKFSHSKGRIRIQIIGPPSHQHYADFITAMGQAEEELSLQ